ncbi:FAD-dependent monooxygenase [Saccharothrix sp. S26]|uniref:FAD-dependent monooxygenase n=1 Tax=Saccharothrix sp. S26 TaxID=2907215 RepID=UPI001F413267|nr:FAD-dependent monooxygenase [Saccharothrix sp. S26]MCE7000786.1 FAD-dependent monooxygenase [Saccharothrix sp. S26]
MGATTGMDIVVAGGGIGGLAAALAAARAGHRATVLERAAEFQELGAGIQLAPNAFHALDDLGVGVQVRRRAVFTEELRLMDGVSGDVAVSLPLTGAYRKRFGNPYAVVHRGDLFQPLLQACRRHPGVDLRADHPVVGYEQDGSGVRAVLADGRRVAGDVLIGADGIRSAVRGQLIGDGAPRVSGHTIYRCVVPMGEVPEDLRANRVTLWAGPKWHFVHYPIARGELLNLAATIDDGASRAVVGEPVPTERVRNLFTRLPPVARRLLHLGRDWRTWVLCDRGRLDRWVDGRVALLGDAAHPMLQYAAQGACMALEDAVVLGRVLGEPSTDVTALLERYNDVRRERAAFAQHVSTEIGTRLYHVEGEQARQRNAMLRGLSLSDLLDRVAPLHGSRGFGLPAATRPTDLADAGH